MSIQNSIVKNHFGEYYKLQLPREINPQLTLKASTFWNPQSTQQFIKNLIVSPGYWREIIREYSTLPGPVSLSEIEIEQRVSVLLLQGQLKLFQVDIPDLVEHPPEKRVIKSSDNLLYRFAPVSTLLLNNVSETKKFSTQKDVKSFLSEISDDPDELITITQELGLRVPETASANQAEITETLSKALVDGEVVIIVDKTSSVPASKKNILEKSNIGNREAGLGAAKENEATTEEKEHLCTLNSMTLSCKHGRSVSLDPSKAIDSKTGTANIIYLDITSASKSSPQKDHELLTAKIDIEDKCGSHNKAPYSISSDSVKLVNDNFGNLIKFYSQGKELNLTTEFYKYIWLPSIKPQSYKISPPSFCNMTKFEGKTKSIKVNVYPDIKWDIGLDIGFGQVKASDTSPKDKNKSKNNVIERKIEQEMFSVQGKAKCTHGNNTIDFVSKFNNKFDVLKQEITDQNALLSKVFGKFEEGDNHSVTLDLPKLSFNGTSSIAEKKGSPDVDVKWDYNIKASPLIGIKAEVDVLPMLIKSSGWGSLFLPLLSELKEKYANPDGSIGVQLQASIILSIAGKVEFDLNFTDKTFVHDEKTELRSLKFDVPFQCTGKLKGKGHLLVFAVELGITADLKSGFAYKMLMGADSNGIYRSSILDFHGLVFEIKAYIQGKIDASGKNKSGEKGLFKNSKRSITSARKKEFNNKWTWIEKGEKEFGKEYIIQT